MILVLRLWFKSITIDKFKLKLQNLTQIWIISKVKLKTWSMIKFTSSISYTFYQEELLSRIARKSLPWWFTPVLIARLNWLTVKMLGNPARFSS